MPRRILFLETSHNNEERIGFRVLFWFPVRPEDQAYFADPNFESQAPPPYQLSPEELAAVRAGEWREEEVIGVGVEKYDPDTGEPRSVETMLELMRLQVEDLYSQKLNRQVSYLSEASLYGTYYTDEAGWVLNSG